MTNPNVPANQADAAKSSAPDAKVMPTQPAQLNQSAPSANPVVTPTTAPTAAPATGAMPVTPTTAPLAGSSTATGTAQSAVKVDATQRDAARDVLKDRQQDQKTGDTLESQNKSAAKENDYFQKVANDDKVFQDPFREQARQERLREAEAHKGDPTRDPVAKQAAMDMNTPAPGAQEEAAKMRK